MSRLVDTSLWVEFFRKKGDPDVKRRLAALIASGQCGFTCPVSFELLAGARPSEVKDIHTALSFAHRYEFQADHWSQAGSAEARLRSKGVTVPRDDVFVAVAAASYRVALACRDRHFALIKRAALPALMIEEW